MTQLLWLNSSVSLFSNLGFQRCAIYAQTLSKSPVYRISKQNIFSHCFEKEQAQKQACAEIMSNYFSHDNSVSEALGTEA